MVVVVVVVVVVVQSRPIFGHAGACRGRCSRLASQARTATIEWGTPTPPPLCCVLVVCCCTASNTLGELLLVATIHCLLSLFLFLSPAPQACPKILSYYIFDTV